MSDTMTVPPEEVGYQALARGAIREALGLEAGDLRPGLDAAQAAIRRGDVQNALAVYIGLVLCDPLDPDYQVGLANCALMVGEAALALQAASAVVATAPQDPRGYLLSGRACLELDALKEAEEDLAEAVRRAADSHRTDIAGQAQLLLDLARRRLAATPS